MFGVFLALAGCGVGTDKSFSYGSGVKNLPGSYTPGDWVSDGRPPATQWPPPRENPVATISIPALGLNQVPIFDRDLDARRTMQIATGYSITRYVRSAFFGSPSNTVLYAHDDIEGGVFGKLPQLKAGDLIYVTLHDQTLLRYAVTRAPTIIPPNYVSILKPTSTGQLTLFTCYPLWQDDHRVFVVATPLNH